MSWIMMERLTMINEFLGLWGFLRWRNLETYDSFGLWKAISSWKCCDGIATMWWREMILMTMIMIMTMMTVTKIVERTVRNRFWYWWNRWCRAGSSEQDNPIMKKKQHFIFKKKRRNQYARSMHGFDIKFDNNLIWFDLISLASGSLVVVVVVVFFSSDGRRYNLF